MFYIRPYEKKDLRYCTECFYNGFFDCNIIKNDRIFMTDYTQILIEKSNFTYVAETDGEVVGFISGTFQKKFNRTLAKTFDNPSQSLLWIKFTIKYLLHLYRFSPEFNKSFKLFFKKMIEIKNMKLGPCDCELVALCSRHGYRKGLGTALLDKFISRCADSHAHSIRVFTNSDATYTFYLKHGFKLIEEKPYDIDGYQGKSMNFELLLP